MYNLHCLSQNGAITNESQTYLFKLYQVHCCHNDCPHPGTFLQATVETEQWEGRAPFDHHQGVSLFTCYLPCVYMVGEYAVLYS